MKIIIASNGKESIKISRKEWEYIGKKAQWNGWSEDDDHSFLLQDISREINLEDSERKYNKQVSKYKIEQNKILKKYKGMHGLHTSDLEILKYSAEKGFGTSVEDLRRYMELENLIQKL